MTGLMNSQIETTIQMSSEDDHILFYNRLISQMAQWRKKLKEHGQTHSPDDRKLNELINKASSFKMILGVKPDIVTFTMSDYVWLNKAIEGDFDD